MNNVVSAFLISALAGLSTMIGSIFAFFKVKEINVIVNKALSFASGVMLTICISDLLPSSFNYLSSVYYLFPLILVMAIMFSVGVCISFIINRRIPDVNYSVDNNRLYKVGIMSMLAIILHNIPEGIATFMTSTDNIKLGISLSIAISLHNIPEGISIAVPIYYSTGSKLKAFMYTFISGISELFGALITYFFLYNYISFKTMGLLLSLIAGIMSYISLIELFPYVLSFNDKKRSYQYFLIGILFMILSHFLFS